MHVELTADRAVLRRNEFERLLELARCTEPVQVQPGQDDTGAGLAGLVQQGRAFEFWNESGEDIQSARGGEV